MLLKDKVMVITGGLGVLGQGVARIAQREGARVILLDIIDAPDGAVGEPMRVDLLSESSLAGCFEQIGEFHILANIAGGFDMGPTVYTTEDEQWDAMFAINVTTLRRTLKAAVPYLLEQGRGSIINVGAAAAARGVANLSSYLAAKSTVMRLTEALSEEVKAQGINVNAVLPSVIDTPRNRADMPSADFGHWVAPEDLGDVICFLGSERARAIHGALVPVTGLS
ncbi:MAG: SDR family oxidoreductase [Gammaproteobacteria bacterium TMED134]|nr:MAG: SDR family oxidoreductase [Gammaproteobacteria bacterium TMED134]RPG47553.1 MAG: SDR family oxidoreductase [Gammaproteobacteria bacterium TMED134]RZO70812.1 MAG: SDR family oxidoreductase [OM182 bacterium]|tara:strand:- start:14937 stop:15608 length:672 start_codon:yes stop_codon:yes gene_type:complete